MIPITNGVHVADAIAKIFARDGIVPRIVVDPTKGPSWNPATGIINLPALPSADLTEKQVAMLRAYFWHESHGEQGLNTWHDVPEIKGNRQCFRLANGVGDAYIDRTILKDRPGAGVDIRQAVSDDCTDFLAKGQQVKVTVGLAAICARYILEAVTTWPAIRQAIPQGAELFDAIEPIIPDGMVPQSPQHVVELTLALNAALENYKSGGEPEEPPQGENGSEGQQDGKKGQSPKGKPQKSDDNSEAGGGEPGDELLRKEDGDGTEGENNLPPNQSAGDGDTEGENSGGDESGDSDSEADSADSDSDGDTEGDGSDSKGGTTKGDRDENDESTDSDGASSGGTQQSSAAKNPPRDLDDGEDSGDRLADKLSDMLKGADQGSGRANRTFDERFRTIVDGKALDSWGRSQKWPSTYYPSPTVTRDAGVLVNRLRAALMGPSMKIERGQEYGRFDARRGAAALAGSRTVYTRRREIPGDDVAVSFAWDESGSMGSKMPAVRAITERFALALKQMTNVKAEFTGWTDGFGAGELGNAGDGSEGYITAQLDGSHNNGSTAVHRIYKSFEESPTVLGPRLQGISARGGTPMAEGFAFSAKRLAARKEKRKVMFFLTDGQADRNDISKDEAWGYNALQYEVDRATANGIDVVVFDIDKNYSAMLSASRHAGHSRVLREEMEAKQAQFGPNARMIFLSSGSNFMQAIFNQLTLLLTKRSRSIAS